MRKEKKEKERPTHEQKKRYPLPLELAGSAGAAAIFKVWYLRFVGKARRRKRRR